MFQIVSASVGDADIVANWRAYLVTLDNHTCRTTLVIVTDLDAIAARAHHVARAWRVAADHRVSQSPDEIDPEGKRVESDRTGRVCADQVPLHCGVAGLRPDLDADVRGVDDIARARRASPDGDSAAQFNDDAVAGRADWCSSGGIGADVVALHERVAAIVQDQDYAGLVGRDHVACRG